MTSDGHDLTALLLDWRGGDVEALERLSPLVYDELRAVAQRQMQGERRSHTLQATAVVHEAFVRLIRADVRPIDRAHFFALAGRIMRRVLVDHAKSRRRLKRGGAAVRVDLSELGDVAAHSDEALLNLDRALERLRQHDPRKADVVELTYFGGLTYDEITQALSISPATVDRDLRFAKAWLAKELRPEA